MAISKKIRFEVFKRDDFICQYCGRKVPDVVLELDHIVPKSKNGKDEISNLITSCFDCNRGKGKNRINKKICREDIKRMSEEIKAKREQLKEYYKLKAIAELDLLNSVNELCEYWYSLSEEKNIIGEQGKMSLKYFLKKIDIFTIYEAIDISFNKNLNNFYDTFKYMCGVLHNKIKDINNG